MSNELAVKLKQLSSSIKQMSDYLNEKILRLTKPLNYSISENDFKSNGFLNEEIEKLILETDGNFNIKRFPKYEGESDDSSRINRCIKASNGKTVTIPDGIYYLSSPIINNVNSSIIMGDNCYIKPLNNMDELMLIECQPYTDEYETYKKTNMTISGGVLDGKGMTDCLVVKDGKHITIDNVHVDNAKNIGLKISGYGNEVNVRNVYGQVKMDNLNGNTFIQIFISDSHLSDCVCIDYTIGIDDQGDTNRMDRCHVWCGRKRSSLINSIGFNIKGKTSSLINCFSDSYSIGYNIIGEYTSLIGSNYYNSYDFCELDNITMIKNPNGKTLRIIGGMYDKGSTPNYTEYSGDSGDVKVIGSLGFSNLPDWIVKI